MSTTSNPASEADIPQAAPRQDGIPDIDGEELAASLIKAIRSDLFSAVQDLGWLHRNGALAGVHEVIRERRRQVEALGHDAGHDDGHVRGDLVVFAEIRLMNLRTDRSDGTADPASDERELRQAGALLAAEIDRLHRMMTPPGAQ